MQDDRLQRGDDHAGAENGEGGHHDHRLLPAERRGDQGEQRREQDLADIAGEIVGAQRRARLLAVIMAATRLDAIGCCVLPPRPASNSPAITP